MPHPLHDTAKELTQTQHQPGFLTPYKAIIDLEENLIFKVLI